MPCTVSLLVILLVSDILFLSAVLPPIQRDVTEQIHQKHPTQDRDFQFTRTAVKPTFDDKVK